MTAGLYDITCEQGATLMRQLLYTDAADVPVDLTGYTAKMEVRDFVLDAVVVTLSSADGNIVLGGEAGTITLTLTAAATGALIAGAYAYDLELTSGAVVTRLLRGSFNVTAQVTR